MTLTMTATEASRGFSALLDRVERDGEAVTITRDGRPIAEIAPASQATAKYTWGAIRKRFEGLIPVDPEFGNDVLSTIDGLADWTDPWGAA
jgi:prevent-host-death family protein